MEKIKALLLKYRSQILYLILGGVTTVVSWGTYALCTKGFGLSNDLSNVLSWLAAVTVAYLTNKPFVFDSHDWSFHTILPESLRFYGGRIGTGVLEYAAMHVLVDMLHYPGMWMKIAVSIVIVILNYVVSRLFVFTKKKS